MKLLMFLQILHVFSYTPICIHCKHYKDVFDSKYGKCKLFPILTDDKYFLVNGIRKKEQDYNYCATARTQSMCGKEAKYFESK